MGGSRALAHFESLESQAAVLSALDPGRARRGLNRQRQRELIYQAGLAAHVASWDSYLNLIVPEFYTKLIPLGGPVPALHDVANELANEKLQRFNTPNAENTRQLLLATMRYDPWPDWNWARARRSSLEVRNLLNEVLRVRHSFAHGFKMPGYGWNQSASGETRLDSRSMRTATVLLRFLARATDCGIHDHLCAKFGIHSGWY